MMRKDLRKRILFVKVKGRQYSDGRLLGKYLIHQQLKILLMGARWVTRLQGLFSMSWDCNRSPRVWISKQEMCASIRELLALGRCKGREGQAEETFKRGILDHLDRAIETDFTNRETDTRNCTHSRVFLAIGRLHEHHLLVLHWCNQFFLYIAVNDNDLTAAIYIPVTVII